MWTDGVNFRAHWFSQSNLLKESGRLEVEREDV